jgi:hypothetical protein
MFVLGFPYALALGALGGVLEFLPAVGWIVLAVVILTLGFLTHSHWIGIVILVVVWRLVQNFVNSPHIMGDNLELQPLTAIFALIVGGQVGGIAGVYLSVPAVAILRIAWLECFSTSNSTTAICDQPLVRVRAGIAAWIGVALSGGTRTRRHVIRNVAMCARMEKFFRKEHMLPSPLFIFSELREFTRRS